MLNASRSSAGSPRSGPVVSSVLLGLSILGVVLSQTPARAQTETVQSESSSCILKNHVYTCDGAVFQKALTSAKTVTIETHNVDGVARSQLQNLITKKLGKTIAPAGGPADLDMLLIPTSEAGIINGSMEADLGTLRVYTSESDGGRGHLLWAENFSGLPNMPWPAVVHGLILKFQSHFHIK